MATRVEDRLSPWVVALSVAAATAILYVRKPDAFLNPQFIAEDGTIFFSQNLSLGIRAHLESYAGYFHELPRLVASFAALFPFRFAPSIYNAAALFVLLLLVVKVHSRRLALPHAPLFALAIVLVPQLTGEVYLSLTNVQWVLALLLLCVAAQRGPKNLREAGPDWLIAVLAGLTGPFAPLLLPVLAARAWIERCFLGAATALLVALTSAIQIVSFLRNPVFVPASAGPHAPAWLDLLGHRLIGTLFLGAELPYRLSPWLLLLVGAIALGSVLWMRRASGTDRAAVPLFLTFGGAVTGLSLLKFRFAPDLLVPPGAAARYFFLFNVGVIWSLLLALHGRPLLRRLLAASLLAAILGSSLRSGFRTPPLPDLHWRSSADKIGTVRPLSIPINPFGWTIEIPGN